MSTQTSVMCGIDGCNLWVTAEWDNGEPSGYDSPGCPGYWWIIDDSHNPIEEHKAPEDMEGLHYAKVIWFSSIEDELNARFDRLAFQSWDNNDDNY